MPKPDSFDITLKTDELEEEEEEEEGESCMRHVDVQFLAEGTHTHKQCWAKEWSLGCVNPASSLPMAAGRKFTQPWDHSFPQPCKENPLYPDLEGWWI